MDLVRQHRIAYDALADEYEARATDFEEITRRRFARVVPWIPSSGSILDVGCGVGLAIQIGSELGYEVTGIDLSSRMAEYARRRNPGVRVIAGDVASMAPEYLGKFDCVFAQAFLHLFPASEVSDWVSLLIGYLKPAGVLTVSTTVSAVSSEGWEAKEDYEGGVVRYRRRWSRAEFTDLILRFAPILLDEWHAEDHLGKHWLVLTARV
jgi:SAM-dependent methyltransferase